MEADEQNIGNNLKRQRAPLSDSEDNITITSEEKDGQKRRRMDAVGQENHSPTQGNHPVTGPKQDTPIVPSVQSRVQQLTQRRGGTPLTQRCLSDPGADSPATIIQDKGFREQLLGEGEFSQRMEKFKVPVCKSDSASSPANPFFRTCSNFVSGIHQKLQDSPTGSEQASRIRQEREKEFSRLHFQPIRENPWLKRSSSDSSLNQQGRTPPGSSSPSFWVPRSKKRVQWPPTQPLDVDADADMKDGSFTQAPTLDAKKPSIHTSGEVTACDSEDPTASSSEGQLQMECKKKNNCQEVRQKGKDDEEESQIVSYDDRSSLYSMCPEESDMKKACEHSNVAAQSESEVLSLDEKKNIDCLYSDEETEPSTDEELRFWRYPQDKVYKEEDFVIADIQKDECAKRREKAFVLSSGKNETGGCVDDCDPSDIQGGECSLSRVSAEIYSSKLHKDNGEEDAYDNSYEACCSGAAIEDSHIFTIRQGQKNTEECPHVDEICQDSNKMQTDLGLESVRTGLNSEVKEMKASAFSDVMQFLKETPRGHRDLQRNTEDVTQPEAEVSPQLLCIDIHDAQSVTETVASEHILKTEGMDQEEVDESQNLTDVLTKETHKAEGKESSKRVFFLEPELINETNNSVESRIETSTSDVEFSSHDETNTAEIIDQMFDEVLEYAGRIEEDRSDDEDTEDRDSGIVACPGDKTDLGSEKEESQEGTKEACDELLTFPPSGILSPLSKSVEAVVTPMRLAVSQESTPLFLLTPQETTTPPAESAPLYSIDAYRTQRQSKLPTIQSITPGVQRRAPEKSQTQQSVNTKERIMILNEEAVKLQTVINQTLQALCCCTDEEHGQGSLQEAEAEKLLLVSCEKRSALLAEVARLREERNSESGEAARDDGEYVSQQPCRGTVSITNIQLPLKVEFVCSSHSRTGRQSHYFFVLVRYGPCNIVATQLATAADAQNGDTISFATSVTLKDIRSSFEIDVEVYSLSHTSGNNCSIDRATTKSRVTPRKLLNSITRSSNTLASAAPSNLSARRSSNFSLVGCHKITLASLGHSKFPLDKMKLEGKIRRLLGDEFQEKVPFLSPLEGNIYLKLHSESHSNVQHQGFLTMFELISGYGVWHRCFFVLEKCNMYYWNHPNDKETKEAEGIIGLSSSPSQCVRPVKKDLCARPFTFELVSNIPHQQQDDSQEAIAKCWFSADTKEERLDWMAKLNQAILDFHTWSRTTSIYTESGQSNTSSSGVHEDILEVALK